MSDALQRIASLASSLTQAELRVLLELAVRVEASGAMETTASSRDLAQATGLARASVQGAIDSLNARRLLQSDTGSPTQSAIHRLVFLHSETNGRGLANKPEVAQLLSHGGLTTEPRVALRLGHGGLITGPGVAQPVSHSGLMVEPGVAQTQGHPGLVSEPPRNEKSVTYAERIKESASVRADSIDFDFDKTIDRLQRAKKGDFEESIFEVARMKIASHHAKYAREENRLLGLPDDAITAQFLAVAEWPKLEALLYDLAAERKEAGYSYGWYVTVALQRIHGLAPARVREMRARLKQSADVARKSATDLRSNENPQRKPFRVERQTESHRSAGIEDLKRQIRAVAAAKSLR